MKKCSLLILVFVALFFTGAVNAEAYLLRVKEGIRGSIHVREAPDINSKIVSSVNASMTWTVPIVEADGEEKDGWIKILAQNNDGDFLLFNKLTLTYKWVYVREGWVAKAYFRQIDAEKEGLLRLQPAEYNYSIPILVHALPDMMDYSMYGNAVINRMNFNICYVKPTGKIVKEWLQIYRQDGLYCVSFIFGEYFGIKVKSEFIKYDKPRVFYTKVSSLKVRSKPSILSQELGYYGYEEQEVIVCGEQYPWCLTNKGKWVYGGLLTDRKEQPYKRF